MVLRYERVYKAVLENRVSKSFLRAIPGLDEYSMLGKAWYHTTEREQGRWRWDIIVMDMQATGHALTMLHLPRAILGAVPEGPLVRDAKLAAQLFEDADRSGMLLVTLAEELPVAESIELFHGVRTRVGIDVAHVIINQLWPARCGEEQAARVLDAIEVADGDPLEPVVRRARVVRNRRELNMRYVEQLAEDVPIPQIHLPLLFAPQFGLQQIEELARDLTQQLG
jgi:anion-transporting  ArsA/GET3 family ATPase